MTGETGSIGHVLVPEGREEGQRERKVPQKTYSVTDELDAEKYAYIFVPEMGDFIALNLRGMEEGRGGRKWRGNIEYTTYEVKHGHFHQRKEGTVRLHAGRDGAMPPVDEVIPAVLGRLYDDPEIAYTRFMKVRPIKKAM